jgi:ATP-dependent RNA helicase SUPV3L1/SUV3
VSRRLARIASAQDADISLGRDGRLRVDGAPVARLAPKAPVLKPRVDLIGAEGAGAGERAAAHERLELWLARTVARDLEPLVALETAWREGQLPPDARGLAFRILESAGALDRASEDLDHMGAEARRALRRCGVRLGRHTIFLPALIRPRAAQTLAVLWHSAHPGRSHSVFLARPGALSAPLDRPRTWAECAAAGYRPCGRLAVRLDLVERLGDAIAAEAPAPDAALAQLIGRPTRELAEVLTSLGYRRVEGDEATPPRWRRAPPRRTRQAAAAADSPFSALANLLPPSAQPPRRRRARNRRA